MCVRGLFFFGFVRTYGYSAELVRRRLYVCRHSVVFSMFTSTLEQRVRIYVCD